MVYLIPLPPSLASASRPLRFPVRKCLPPLPLFQVLPHPPEQASFYHRRSHLLDPHLVQVAHLHMSLQSLSKAWTECIHSYPAHTQFPFSQVLGLVTLWHPPLFHVCVDLAGIPLWLPLPVLHLPCIKVLWVCAWSQNLPKTSAG